MCNVGILFLLVVDRVMRKTTKHRPRGLKWDNGEYLEDLDYADDIVLLAQSWNDSQENLADLQILAKEMFQNLHRQDIIYAH